jgi:hypothetical protein
MPVGVLIGVMGFLTIVCVYFWLVRSKPSETPKANPQ